MIWENGIKTCIISYKNNLNYLETLWYKLDERAKINK